MSTIELSKSSILSNLNTLHGLYSDSQSDVLRLVFYSKLALIEYCGWLECSIDIIMNEIVKHVQNDQLRRIGEGFIKKVHGFSYDQHFILLLVQTFGVSNTDKLYRAFEASGKLDILRAKLNNAELIQSRNKAAHTYHIDASVSYNSPEIYINDVELIYSILKEIYDFICNVLTMETV
ncbi:hypothetical protein [Acinetobacter calcoaceticus]|uniref:hypothetical protein n=1 Tax=Acinetobacter calcoaceticus TaxID=471 RepID=UPI001AE22D55|nr:hypothetical protein [Acinetobacter calcoaceticus]MBP2603777.1 hypothetical protein [Acinetobacter calcoaceticus]